MAATEAKRPATVRYATSDAPDTASRIVRFTNSATSAAATAGTSGNPSRSSPDRS
jgi:hypothetical protein